MNESLSGSGAVSPKLYSSLAATGLCKAPSDQPVRLLYLQGWKSRLVCLAKESFACNSRKVSEGWGISFERPVTCRGLLITQKELDTFSEQSTSQPGASFKTGISIPLS